MVLNSHSSRVERHFLFNLAKTLFKKHEWYENKFYIQIILFETFVLIYFSQLIHFLVYQITRLSVRMILESL